MTINLREIRTAVINYVDTMVTVSISNITPLSGSVLAPNEDFQFTLEAKNTNAADGGIPLMEVIWHVWVGNENVAKLYVPEGPIVARAGISVNSQVLNPGTKASEMYLFPPHKQGYLGVGETDTIDLSGKAGKYEGTKETNIKFNIYADVDMEWLFPKDEATSTIGRHLIVFG